MRRAVLWILVFVFLLVPVLAEDLVFKEGENITLKKPCYVNNSWCDSSVGCNISVFSPNSTTLVNNKPMVFQTSFFSYNLGSLSSGLYAASMTCVVGSSSGFKDFNFWVTRNGVLLSTYNVTLYVLAMFFVVSFTIGMFWLASNFKINIEAPDKETLRKAWLLSTVELFVKWLFRNMGVAGTWLFFAFGRVILQSQSVGNEFFLKFIDYFMMFYTFLVLIYFFITIYIVLSSIVVNKKILELKLEDYDDED